MRPGREPVRTAWRPTGMTNLRLLAVSLLFALLGGVLLSCGDRGGEDPASPADGATKLDVTYVVTGATVGGKPRSLVKGSEIRLRFDGDRLGISAGCNTMGGTYTLDGTRLTTESLSMTDMGCDAPLMDQDTWLAGLFDRDVQLTRAADASLISGDVVLALADRRQVSPDKPFDGTFWQLDTIAAGGADGTASSVGEGVVVYVRIDGQRFDAYDGCTGGVGQVEVAGSTVTFRLGAMDDIGCAGPDGLQAQRLIRAMLDGQAVFAVEESRMTLTEGTQVLGFRAVAERPQVD